MVVTESGSQGQWRTYGRLCFTRYSLPSSSSALLRHLPLPSSSSSSSPSSSLKRRIWLWIVYSLTCCIPPIAVSKDKAIRTAWREKVALCLLIALLCGSLLFFIIGLGWVLCPPTRMLSMGQLAAYASLSNPLVAIDGYYYNIAPILQSHIPNRIQAQAFMASVSGNDVSAMFARNNGGCAGKLPR